MITSGISVKFAFTILLILVLGLLFLPKYTNNVCTSFWDYYGNRDNNKNCYYNPEFKLNAAEIIKRRGYDLEEYHVTTKDDYIVTLFRVRRTKNSTNSGPPILLQHGASINCAPFVNRGKKSLAFILADNGYDVWLGNIRGTLYSKRHKYLEHTEKEYWNFNSRHLAIHDTFVNIDLIYKVTNQKIIYIGYSLGSTLAYIYSVTFPRITKDRLRIIISLAPAASFKNMKSIILYLSPYWRHLKWLITTFTDGGLYLLGRPQSSLREAWCTRYPFQMYFCQFLNMLTMGFDYEQNDPETLPISIQQNADAMSYTIFLQVLQSIQSGRFMQYDHGVEYNLKLYGSTDPPSYNASLLRVPTYLIRGENDLFITTEDVDVLHNSVAHDLARHGIYTVNYSSFNHGDFLVARDVVPLLYNHIIEFLRRL